MWLDATISQKQKNPSLAHKYNAGPLKSFALAMISRNVEEVMTAFFITRKVQKLVQKVQKLYGYGK